MEQIIYRNKNWYLLLDAGELGLQRLSFLTKQEYSSLAKKNIANAFSRKELQDLNIKLDKYFSGEPIIFDEPMDLQIGTPFQQKVWQALLTIDFGKYITYKELADKIDKPKAARAVGNAVGANPIPLIIPCHRVIAAGKRLGGFSAGLDIKRALLAVENILL